MAEIGLGNAGTLQVGRATGQHGIQTGISRAFCGDLSAILTAFVITVSAVAACLLVGEAQEWRRYLSLGLLMGVATSSFYNLGGFFEFDRLLSTWRTLRSLVWRWLLVLFTAMALSFATETMFLFDRNWFVAFGLIGAGGIVATRFATAWWLRRLTRDGGALNRRIAIVGATEIAGRFMELMADKRSGVSIAGVYDDRIWGREDQSDVIVAGDLEMLISRATRGEIDDIVICLPWSADLRIDEVFRRLSILPVNTVVCPDMLWLTNVQGGISYLGGIPLLNIHKRALEGWGSVLKTIEDRLIAGIMLAALSPVMLVVAALVKLDSRGPVLFGQKRHGFCHDVFTIYKFRTMTVMEDGDTVRQASREDARVTRVGRFLRRYSLDELPQLWNVLKGDMSLVGPRPHAVSHNEEYARKIQDYAGRHKVKPGITGWAQVNGLRGETSETSMMADRVRYDLSYIENWTILFDLRILLMTLWAVIFPKNAF